MGSSKNQETVTVKEKLILAGLEEIEKHGIEGCSLRKIAAECGVSCAAPYKHFIDKRAFIVEIIKYINNKWYARQDIITAQYGGDTRKLLTKMSLEYIRFLLENPNFRSIIMFRDNDMDPEHIKMKSELSECTKYFIHKYCEEVGMDKETEIRKTFVVRSIIYGAALMMDNGELKKTPENFAAIERTIDREFELD